MAERCRRNVPRTVRQRGESLSRQWLGIANPHSNGNRNPARLAEILGRLQPIAAKIVFTRYPGHASELALDSQAYKGIAVVGGDGTLFEILRGIDRTEQRVALIPAGRGNSLARDLGLVNGHGPLAAMHWETARSIDLLEVTATDVDGVESKHLSASTVAVGYPAAVVLRARKLAHLGKMSYAVAAAAMLPQYFDARVQYGDGIPREVRLSGFIANNTQHLANFLTFRNGSCCDGRFEVMEMDAGMVKQTMHNLSALSGTGVYEPYADKQAASAKVTLETPQHLMLDGEILPDVVAFDIRILPAALECNGPRAR
jgi:diacylglycerol kinase (ATP)